jgi:class 3 adenylate cyclase
VGDADALVDAVREFVTSVWEEGDGFFASFDRPARAIRCATAIVESIPKLGLAVRAGLHTGECELVDDKVAGIAVHTGARVASQARPGEVLVSSTVKDLVAGSGLAFEDRGAHDQGHTRRVASLRGREVTEVPETRYACPATSVATL